MTIACCYVSPEGVIIAADSTASYAGYRGMRHYNHNQKVFQVGNESTLGFVTWGLGGLGTLSYRTLIARLADELEANPATSVAEVMDRWIAKYWAAYSSMLDEPAFKPQVDLCRALGLKTKFLASAVPAPAMRTQIEEQQFQQINESLIAGFCIGGYVLPERTPVAYFTHFQPSSVQPPAKTEMRSIAYEFWGAPNIFRRLIFGIDDVAKESIINSDKWTGSLDDLNMVLAPQSLGHPIVPLRDAIDFVHMCINSTIKALKFSHFPRVCGGPIELAVISTDRPFRWVRHKPWDAAVAEGATS